MPHGETWMLLEAMRYFCSLLRERKSGWFTLILSHQQIFTMGEVEHETSQVKTILIEVKSDYLTQLCFKRFLTFWWTKERIGESSTSFQCDSVLYEYSISPSWSIKDLHSQHAHTFAAVPTLFIVHVHCHLLVGLKQ